MKFILPSLFALFLIGCAADEADTDAAIPAGTVSIPDGFGKSDNYIATSAREYTLRGVADAKLPDDVEQLADSERSEAIGKAVERRTTELTRAAKRHVEKVLDEANDKRLDENPLPEPDPDDPDAAEPEDPFVDYFIYVKPSERGGMAEEVVVDGTTATFEFSLEFVGSNELIELLIGDADEAFEIEVDDLDGNPTELRLDVEASPSSDSFPRYDVLFEDGVYDLAIIFGGDYNEERYDLETAKWTVEFLLESGWENPEVTTFEELKHDSPPFTTTLVAEGRTIEARVYIVHAQLDNDAGLEQSLLRDLVETSVKERDVVIYSGHAGTNAGMILDYHPRFELDDSEFDDIEMRDDYQIYVFDGCNSYRTYVDALLANEARSYETTDIVTTVNTTPFSAGYEVINRFVHWLTLTGDDGAHFPVSWNTLLRGVNDSFLDVHYGVHGIDQSPKLNPHGGAELMCSVCDTNADCGAGANFCMNYDDGSACAVACTTDEACGDGYECISVFDDPDLFYIPKQCVRRSLTCG